MERIKELFEARNFNEVIAQTLETNDHNALFLRARAYIALDDLDNALATFKTAVAACGVWLDSLGPFGDFQDALGEYLITQSRTCLNKVYDDLNPRLLTNRTYDNFDRAAGLINTYNSALQGMREAMTLICPAPEFGIQHKIGRPARSRAFTVLIEDWVNTIEKLFTRALTLWAENADAILAEPEYRNATFGDIIGGQIGCNNVCLLLSRTIKEDYPQNISQCDRLIDLIIRVVGTATYFEHGSMPLVSGDLRQKLVATCEEAIVWRKSAEPGYIPPQIPPQPPTLVNRSSASSTSSGGCYVATCVYGSYDCPQVWTLRRFRDNTLAETWYGRAFIKTYYAISPTLVKWFGHTEWFKKMWKGKLDRMVASLNAEGVENTPYEDRRW